MKRFQKQLCSLACWLLLIPMLITGAAAAQNCPGGCAHQAAIGSTHFDTLAEALTAAEAEATVTLLQDVSLQTALAVEKALTLDLGGKTLTGAVHCKADTTLQNGTVAVTDGSAVRLDGCAFTAEKGLTLTGQGEDPVIWAKAAQDSPWEVFLCPDAAIAGTTGLKLEGSGKLDISGGKIETLRHCITLVQAETDTLELALVGGTFTSKEGEVLVAEGNAQLPTGFVTGGTYAPLPRTYIPGTCRVTENADGSGTVISAYTLHFDANGGAGTMAAVTAENTAPYRLPQCGFTAPKGTVFWGWEIESKEYAPGSAYVLRSDVTVKALWHSHSGGKATCTDKAVCDGCGEYYGSLGSHKLSFVDFQVPTCTANGTNSHHKCAVCGQRFVDGKAVSASSLAVAPLGHSLETVAEVPATCLDAGTAAYERCITCGVLLLEGAEVTEDALILPPAGHTLEEVPQTQATCKEPGILAHSQCTVCGILLLEDTETDLQALTTATASHVLSDWATDETSHWKTCVDCGEQFRWAPHSDADLSGNCDDCGSPVAVNSAEAEEESFSMVFLLPLLAAVIIALMLILKKRK